jgi:hypothetical protein
MHVGVHVHLLLGAIGFSKRTLQIFNAPLLLVRLFLQFGHFVLRFLHLTSESHPQFERLASRALSPRDLQEKPK